MEMSLAASLLRVDVEASEAEIRSAYKSQALKKHPDVPGGSTDAFRELHRAYSTLMADFSADEEYYDVFEEIVLISSANHVHNCRCGDEIRIAPPVLDGDVFECSSCSLSVRVSCGGGGLLTK